jgi:hypothetical protein
MITISFLEWAEQKIEEGVAFQYDTVPEVGDIVISNPAAFFKKVLYVPGGKSAGMKVPKIKNTNVSPEQFSSWKIDNIEGRAASASRLITGTYASKSQGAPRNPPFDIKRLRDVSQSFGGGSKKYFIDLGRSKSIDKLYRVYLDAYKYHVDEPEEPQQQIDLTPPRRDKEAVPSLDDLVGSAAPEVEEPAGDSFKDLDSLVHAAGGPAPEKRSPLGGFVRHQMGPGRNIRQIMQQGNEPQPAQNDRLRRRFVAWYDPWKYNKDQKIYAYYD